MQSSFAQTVDLREWDQQVAKDLALPHLVTIWLGGLNR